MAAAPGCVASVLGGLAASHVTGTPWWAWFALIALALLAGCLRTVIPQDSKDKLALWAVWLSRKRAAPAEPAPERLRPDPEADLTV